MFQLDSCLTMVQPLPGNLDAREDQLTQWQTWVVCTSPPSDAQAQNQPGNHTFDID